MKPATKGFCTHCMLVLLEALAVILLLLLLVGGGLFWRLQSGPIDVSFAKDEIESALRDPTSGYSVRMNSVVLSWPSLRAPLTLEIDNMSLVQNDLDIVQIDRLDLGLSGLALLFGRIEPARIVLYKPALNFIRDEQGEFHFGLSNETLPAKAADEQAAPADSTSPLMRIVRRLSQPLAEIDDRSPLDHLQSLEINDARMVVEDHILGMTWFLPNLDLLFARQAEGLVMTAALELPGGRNGAASIRADMAYNRAQDDFSLQAHIQDLDPHIVSTKIESLSFLDKHDLVFNGNIRLRLDSDMNIKAADLSVRSEEGYLTIDDVYDVPLPYEALVAEASYDAAAGLLDVREISLTTKGITLALQSQIKIAENEISAPVTLRIPNLPQDQIAPVWPDALRDEPVEEWLLRKLSGGRLHDIQAGFHLLAQKNEAEEWLIDAQDITVDFDIENMDIDYRAPLTPVKKADGHGHFSGDILKIDINKAALSDLTVTEAAVEIDRIIEAGTGTAKINVKLNGPLQSVFAYVGPEPIGMDASRLGFDPKAVKGQAALDVDVTFPTTRDLKTEEVQVGVNGTLNDVFLPNVVKDMDLTGGPLQLTVGDGIAALAGSAKLEGYPLDLTWKQYLESAGKPWDSRITANLSVNADLRQRLGIDLSDWVAGTLPVDVVYTEYNGGRSEVEIKGDVNPVVLMIKPFDFEKPVGVPGQVQCRVAMNKGHVQKIEALRVDSAALQLRNANFFFQSVKGQDELVRGTIDRALFGENDTGVEFEIAPTGLVKVTLNGAFMDAQPFLKDDEQDKAAYDGPALQTFVDVDAMRTHPEQTVQHAKIYLDMNKQGELQQLEMDGVAGNGAVYFRFKPDASNKMTVRFEADDAGAALRAFGLYEDVQGGTLVLYGEATNSILNKQLKGHMQINEFQVTEAPVLARLISRLGPTGFSQLLSDDGIYFARLESDFEWYIRPQGDLYLINDGRTSGSSLGLTFDGKIDKAKKHTDITGTIVPMSTVNQLISNIPILGDILAGGRGGAVFAATYSVKGNSDDPDISVNPLSVLAPGILRKLLFEGDSDG